MHAVDRHHYTLAGAKRIFGRMNGICNKCGHEWELRKPPAQHDRGVRCPSCGSPNVSVEGDDDESSDVQAAPEQGQSPAQANQNAAIEVATTAADTVFALGSDDPVEAASARADVLTMIGGGLARAGQRHAQQVQQENEAAKNTSQDDIRVSDHYPRCPECDVQLTSVPATAGAEFECPSCGVMLSRD